MKFTFEPESKPLPGYTIKRAIQKGGFGEVYYALSDAGKEVALKLLIQNPDREVRGTQQCLNLKHPNLVTIFDIRHDDDEDIWIVMEYVTGQTLDQILTDEFPDGMAPEEAHWWLSGLAAGVDFLHDRGIVHRDLKPANVYREGDQVKIGDVGLSKIITTSQRGAQTESIGTVSYMAPEVSRGEYGREVDVYSSGIMLFELLTGRVPFEGETTAEILMKHLSEEPDLSPLPAELRPVLARALAKDPATRTATLKELEAEFQAALLGKSSAKLPILEIPQDSFTTPDPQVIVPPRKPAITPGPAQRRPVYSPVPLNSLSMRRIPMARRLTELTGSMIAVIPFSGLLAFGLWSIGFFSHEPNPIEGAMTFGLTALVAAWAVQVGSKIWEGTGPESHWRRRLSLAAVGSLVGATVWWFNQALWIEMPYSTTAGLATDIGVRERYIIFFTLLFGLRRWWWHTDSFRMKRLLIFSLPLTWVLGELLAYGLGIPRNHALGWAIGIACVVQLASHWVPPENRLRYLEVLTNG